MLLGAGANLEYRNCRSWTSVLYLWDPEHSWRHSTSEILDICAAQGFSGWNGTDGIGWSPVHRAAAYGSGEDIYNLAYKGANLQAYTTDYLWGPITCAVWNKNQETFDALIDLLSREEIIQIRDSRGWTLLHFAAQVGSEQLVRRLVELGVEINARTMPTSFWVTEDLEGKRLTATEIAYGYGHGELWDNVVQAVKEVIMR